MNAQADADPETLRISIDTKATVHVGEYSRKGQSRGLTAVEAWDHDMRPKEKLVPGGILEPVAGRSFLFFGNSNKTSDFLVDGLVLWWEERKQELSHVKQLVINSKYNSIERYWAGLEKSWNGYLLDSVTTVLNRAGNFVWRGRRTTAMLLETVYEKGIKLCAKEKAALENRLLRSPELHWWDIAILPKMV